MVFKGADDWINVLTSTAEIRQQKIYSLVP